MKLTKKEVEAVRVVVEEAASRPYSTKSKVRDAVRICKRETKAMGADEHAIEILRKRGPMTCASLGEALWGRSGRGSCSCPWARPAGRVLHRLLRAGRVRKTYEKNGHAILWEAT